jgi:hypothetical protein
MVRIFGFAVVVLYVSYMFSVSGVKWSPVCLMYFIGQLMHFFWYTPFFSYLSVCVYGFNMFCMVFFVLNAISICVSLKSCVSFLVCFP